LRAARRRRLRWRGGTAANAQEMTTMEAACGPAGVAERPVANVASVLVAYVALKICHPTNLAARWAGTGCQRPPPHPRCRSRGDPGPAGSSLGTANFCFRPGAHPPPWFNSHPTEAPEAAAASSSRVWLKYASIEVQKAPARRKRFLTSCVFASIFRRPARHLQGEIRTSWTSQRT